MKVKRLEDVCVNEAKRIGFMVDRASELQLKIGDILTVYFSEQRYQYSI